MSEETFGRYKLSRQMAVGGMAEIWLARQRGPGGFEKVLVLKRILPHLAADEAFVQMFLDEARLAAQLSHPHIAAVTDFGEVEEVYYLAMELVRGPDLKRLLRACAAAQVTIPPGVAARIVSQVCAALDYAHKARDGQGQPLNVIHRDVSPQNILVTLDGDAKLVDFGIARAMSQSVHTQSGMVKGKFNYMAPEQLSGEPIDARTDLFAAGLVLYELLTGRQGYEGEGQSIITRVLDAKVRPAHELRADVPAPLLNILQRALHKDPAQRYPSAAAMEAELEQFLVSQGAPVTSRTVAAFLASVPIPGADPLADAASPASAPGAERTELRPDSSPKRKAIPRPKPAAKPMPEPEPEGDDGAEEAPEHRPEDGETFTDLASATVLTAPKDSGAEQADPQVHQETVLAPAQKRPVSTPPRRPGPAAPPPRRPAPAETQRHPAADPAALGDDESLKTIRAMKKRSPAALVVVVGALALAAVVGFALLTGDEPAPVEDKPLAPPSPPVAQVPPDAGAPLAAAEPEPAEAAAGPDAGAPVAVAQGTPEPKQPEPKIAEPKQPVPEPTAPKPQRPEPTKPLVAKASDKDPKAATAAPTPTPTPAGEPGLLSILAQPWVYVRIDGQDAGQTPLLKKSLPAGTHRVTLVNPDLGLRRELALEIQAGQERKEVVKFGKAKLTFVAVPWAEVRIDGKLLGQTPMPPQEVYEGVRTLVASNPDTGKKIDRELAIEAGKDQTVKLDLR